MRKIIFVADDFGMTKSINSAIIKAYKKGSIQQAAILVNGFAFNHAIKLAKSNPQLEISVHLNASFQKPVLKIKNSLTDSKGNFVRDNGWNLEFKPNQKDLFNEFDAQVKKALNAKLNIVAINCHHNIQMYDGVKKSFLKIAKKYNLSFRNAENKIHLKQFPNFKGIHAVYGNTTFYGKNASLEEIERIFKNMSSKDVIDIQCHPGFISDKLMKISSYNFYRKKEFDLLISDKFFELVKKMRIDLTTYQKERINFEKEN